MKLTINLSPAVTQTEIIINCPTVTPELQAIIDRIHLLDCAVSGRQGEEQYRLPVESILYFDSVDGRSFAYCENACYEVAETITELADRFGGMSFVRISKNTIVCLRALKSARAIEFSRMLLTLNNGEQLTVNRHYLAEFKQAFGL